MGLGKTGYELISVARTSLIFEAMLGDFVLFATMLNQPITTKKIPTELMGIFYCRGLASGKSLQILFDYKPASRRRASALSVFSHGTSRSLRPK